MSTSFEHPARLVIGTLGLDQHEVGAMAVSALLVRHGYEVVYAGRFNTPERLARTAEHEDADAVGVSVHSWELVAYIDELVERAHRAGIAVVVGGSVLTEQDRAELQRKGVDAVFGAYASEADMMAQLDALVTEVRAGRIGLSPAPSHARPPGHGKTDAGSDDSSGSVDDHLRGRVVAVTGAGRGLGRAYTIELAKLGAAVVAVDLDVDALHETVDIAGRAGSVTALPADVTSPDTGARLLHSALHDHGRLHALVANAGLLRSGPILRIDDADVRAVFDVHVMATFALLRNVGQYWRTQAKGGHQLASSVVLTSSAAGLYGFRGEAAYSAAKAAVAALTVTAADELGRYGTTVNAVAPVARTRLTTWMPPPEGDSSGDPFAPELVAPVVAWLVGTASRSVTGRLLEVGGGTISAPRSWQEGPAFPLGASLAQADADALLSQVLASSPAPMPLLSAEVGLIEISAAAAPAGQGSDPPLVQPSSM